MPLAHLRSLLAAVALALACTLALPARATDYTDLWWRTGGTEDGWGVNLVQNEDKIFATFYIYGQSLQPTWYSALMTANSTFSSFTGPLYATSGSFFGNPWDPAQHPTPTLVGTATFTPDSSTTGTLSYNVDNLPGGNVSVQNKPIQRFKLATIVIGGKYVGTGLVTLSGCADGSRNGTTVYDINTTVAQFVGGTLTFDFVYIDFSNDTCTMTGAAAQEGQLFRVPSATYSCTLTTGINTTATLYEVKATALGIEGRWIASINGGCQEDGRFTGLLQ